MRSLIFGLLKVGAVLSADYWLFLSLTHRPPIAAAVLGCIGLYVMFGGHLALLREGGINWRELPGYDRETLESARQQLAADMRENGGFAPNLRLYLIPGDREMQSTAYGAGCIGISAGMLENADPVTLIAVLAHASSHTLRCDPEFNRALLATITLLLAGLSVLSAAAVVVLFLLFLLLSCFRSWLGLVTFHGSKKAVTGLFSLLQRVIVGVYQAALGLFSRHAEFCADRYVCRLGYGMQLIHFLSFAAPEQARQYTLREALYRSRPEPKRRIARMEAYLSPAKECRND